MRSILLGILSVLAVLMAMLFSIDTDNTGGRHTSVGTRFIASETDMVSRDAINRVPTAAVAVHHAMMTELSPAEIPPLDAGMVNVSPDAAGYRLDPEQFLIPNSSFLIALPYDPSLLPQGFTEDDIQTYVYDRQYRRWIAIERDSVNEIEMVVYSRFSQNTNVPDPFLIPHC